jgi:hypothetical protein
MMSEMRPWERTYDAISGGTATVPGVSDFPVFDRLE